MLPIVGRQPLREVTFTSLQLLLNKLAADGYGETSVGRIRTYIKACFEYATDEDLVSKNPVRKLEMPTIRKKVCEPFLDTQAAVLCVDGPIETSDESAASPSIGCHQVSARNCGQAPQGKAGPAARTHSSDTRRSRP